MLFFFLFQGKAGYFGVVSDFRFVWSPDRSQLIFNSNPHHTFGECPTVATVEPTDPIVAEKFQHTRTVMPFTEV